jgi:hypothetical protein
MEHRHINHRAFTTAAIDDIIDRGTRADWVELREAVVSEPVVLQKVLHVCAAHAQDPFNQRYHLWRLYANRRLA